MRLKGQGNIEKSITFSKAANENERVLLYLFLYDICLFLVLDSLTKQRASNHDRSSETLLWKIDL